MYALNSVPHAVYVFGWVRMPVLLLAISEFMRRLESGVKECQI
jgi:hypothetical protein